MAQRIAAVAARLNDARAKLAATDAALAQATGMLGTARKRNLKFAAKVLCILMAQEEIGQGPGIGRHVKALVVADAGQRARRHVTYHVATGLTRGDAYGRQAPHEVWRIVNMHEVQLKILPRRDVTDGIRVLFRQVGQRLHLLGGQASKGNFDALHAWGIPHRLWSLGQLP